MCRSFVLFLTMTLSQGACAFVVGLAGMLPLENRAAESSPLSSVRGQVGAASVSCTHTPVPPSRLSPPVSAGVPLVGYSRVQLNDTMLQIARRFGVTPEFSPEIQQELLAYSEQSLELDALEDLTDLDFITIDNDHSKDLDQAMRIVRGEQGYTVYYAIADASYFVKEGSALEARALARLFTTYLPGNDVPILPRKISEDLCSLVPGKERRAVVAVIEVDLQGTVRLAHFKHAKVLSVHQTSYRLVDQFYADPHSFEPQHPFHANPQVADTLVSLQRLGRVLSEQALQRGVVPIHSQRELRLVEKEKVLYLETPQSYQVELWNAEISILTNRAVAEYLQQKGVKLLHRYHPRPQKKRVAGLKKDLARLDLAIREGESLAHYASRLDLDSPKSYAALQLLSRVNDRAVYSTQRHGHYGLKIEGGYTHFTAPMRRAADLFVHRVLLDVLSGVPVRYQEGVDLQVGSYPYLAAQEERLSQAQQRESRIYRCCRRELIRKALEPHMNQIISGTVVSRDRRSVQVRLDQFPFDVDMELRDLSGKSRQKKAGGKGARSQPHQRKAVGELGDSVKLKVQYVSDQLRLLPVTSRAG